MPPSLDIIIVNWNAGQQLYQCLESISACIPCEFNLNRVVVVDNASSDGSLETLKTIRLPLVVIPNRENHGFGKACNQGAAGSAADYLLFLNPDTRLLSASLSRPIHFLEQAENRGFGLCGIQLIDEDGRVSRTCARFPRPGSFWAKMLGLDHLFPRWFRSHFMTDWDHADSRIVDQVMGAFLLTRRSVFDTLGGFDERFFVYFEDLDFSLRALKAGWRTIYLADAQAFHKGHGTSEQVKARRLYYFLRSRIQYGYKHFGFVPATLLALGTLILEPISRLMLALAHHSRQEACEALGGIGLLWRSVGKLSRSHSGR